MAYTATHAPTLLLSPLMQGVLAQLPPLADQPGARPAPAAAREQLLSYLALNAHFSPADIAGLRELLARYPAPAVYTAVQRACRQRQQSQPEAASKARESQLGRVLLSPLYHFAYLAQRQPAAA